MSYDVVEAKSFWDCVISMRNDDKHKADLVDTMIELRQQPFRNPRLQTHDLGFTNGNKKVFSSDVGGRAADRNYFEKRCDVGILFSPWKDTELKGFGFSSEVVAILREINSENELLECEEKLGPEVFAQALNVFYYRNPAGIVELEEDSKPQAEEPDPTEADFEMERKLADESTNAAFMRTEPALLKEILAQPIEDWMVFLHPDQRGVVARNYSGPARVRGAAGTGKTVVGLHRAAHRAVQNRGSGGKYPILFTTFIKNLPPVLGKLYLRLPGTREDEVKFANIDQVARRVCLQAGEKPVTDLRKIEAAFAKAFKRVVSPSTPLGDSGFSRSYLRDEVRVVIKGRGIASLDEYLEITRTGRRAPLGRLQRMQVWALMQEWDKELSLRGTLDFQDVILRARDHAQRLAEPWYSSVIVDEAQDLTLVGLQLVRALVNAPEIEDRPNGLLLLGDGAQRVYAGGFKLRQAGIEVRGRTTVLRRNYRNTDVIIAAAQAVAGEADVDDLCEKFQRKDEVGTSFRSGSRPLLVEAVNVAGQIDEVAQRTKTYTADANVGLGDIGVLVPTNRLVGQVLEGLSAHGTFPFCIPGANAEETAEADDLSLSQLFVAMTRARDHLVVLYSGMPSAFIVEGLDWFEDIPA